MGCAPYPFIVCGTGNRHHWGGPVGGLFALGAFVLWIWTLVDVLRNETDEGNQRLLWGLVVGFAYIIGTLIYLIVRRPERMKKLGR